MTLMPGLRPLSDENETEPASPDWPVFPSRLPGSGQETISVLASGLAPELPPQDNVAKAPAANLRAALILSLTLHLALAAAFIRFSDSSGRLTVPSEAISVEILPSAVFEALTQSPAEEAAASPSALGSVAQMAEPQPIPEEPAPQPPESAETPEIDRQQEVLPQLPPPDRAETVEPQRPVEAAPGMVRETPVDRLQPEQAKQEPFAAAELPPPPDEEAVTLPSGREQATEAAREPTLTPQPRPMDTALPRQSEAKPESQPRRKPPQRRSARERAVPSAGSAGARGAEGRQASEGRISASRGSAINYAGIVRARIAANRPGLAASRGAVTVDFAVSETGALAFVRASGPGELARSVEAAVRRAAPFPPPPPGAPRRFRMTFVFR